MSIVRPSLRWKIVLPAILTTVTAVLLFARYTIERVGSTMESDHQQMLQAAARMLARDSGVLLALAEHGDASIELADASLDEVIAIVPSIQRIEVYRDADGLAQVVLGRGSVGAALLEPWGDLSEDGVRAFANDHSAGFVVSEGIWADSDEVEAIDHGQLIEPEELPASVRRRRIGTLLVWASRRPIVEALYGYVRSVVPVGLGLVALALFLGVFLASRLLRHLANLAHAAAELGQGRRDVRIPVRGNDEIAALSKSFNSMAQKLEVSGRRIEEQNRTLENKVESRTQELQHALEELQSLDSAKDSFLSSVSHELRTPLTSIRSFAEILLEYGDDEDPALRNEFLQIIKDESERLSRLINDVLDLAKIEAGCVTWELHIFDMRELVESTVRALAGLKREKNVDFAVDVPADRIDYLGDRDRLHQVLTNLITNAWKFSPVDGEIRVQVRRIVGGVEVRVADRGPGIPGEEEKERIFDRFRQGQHSLTDKPDGTGLGLPISKEIVVTHGGFMACVDREGGGAVFLFLLPDPDPAAPRPIDRIAAGDNNAWTDLAKRRHAEVASGAWQAVTREQLNDANEAR